MKARYVVFFATAAVVFGGFYLWSPNFPIRGWAVAMLEPTPANPPAGAERSETVRVVVAQVKQSTVPILLSGIGTVIPIIPSIRKPRSMG